MFVPSARPLSRRPPRSELLQRVRSPAPNRPPAQPHLTRAEPGHLCECASRGALAPTDKLKLNWSWAGRCHLEGGFPHTKSPWPIRSSSWPRLRTQLAARGRPFGEAIRKTLALVARLILETPRTRSTAPWMDAFCRIGAQRILTTS